MAIKQVTPMAAIEQHLALEIQRRKDAILYAFKYVGERCINEARTNGSYKDRTGNLRSSIGYLILHDGAIHTASPFDGNEGGQTGKALIDKLVAEFPHGIALVVVAGMKYAAAVEARNFNVLTSAELLAEQQVPTLLKTLGFTK